MLKKILARMFDNSFWSQFQPDDARLLTVGPQYAPINRLFVVFELQLPGLNSRHVGNGVFVGDAPTNLQELRELERDILKQANFTYPTATNVVITNIQSLTPHFAAFNASSRN